VAQHLNVDGSDEKFFHLLLGDVALLELYLESLCLVRDQLVFLLLGTRLADRFNEFKKFF